MISLRNILIGFCKLGIGKTTIVKNVCSLLQEINMPIVGFYTEELRKNEQRIGFDVINVNGGRSPLARIGDGGNSPFKVGRYNVLINEFESIALPIFQRVRFEILFLLLE